MINPTSSDLIWSKRVLENLKKGQLKFYFNSLIREWTARSIANNKIKLQPTVQILATVIKYNTFDVSTVLVSILTLTSLIGGALFRLNSHWFVDCRELYTIAVQQRSPILLLESYCTTDFSINPNQTHLNLLIIGYLVITDRCVGAGL